MSTSKQKEYWEKATPMTFGPEKWTYEQKRKFRYELQSYQLNQFFYGRDLAGKRLLDFGCGSGIDSIEFARAEALVNACDITENACDQTIKSRGEYEERFGKLPLKVDYLMDPPRLPYISEYFDYVYSFGVLHHIPEVDKTLNELVRVLKPGGTFMGMVYNQDSLLFSHSILKRYWEDQEEPSALFSVDAASMYSERIENTPYTKCYTKKELENLLTRSLGLKDVKVVTKYNVIDLPGQRKVKYTLDPPDDSLGWHLCFEATK